MPKSGAVTARPGAPPTRIVALAAVVGLASLVVLASRSWLAARDRSPVQGQVHVDGRPVTFGVVTVVTAGGATLSARIRPDGTYSLPHVPPGPVRIAVASPEPRTVFQKAHAEAAVADPGGRGVGPGLQPRSAPGGGPQAAPDAGVSIAMKVEGGPPSAQPPARPEHAQWFRIPGRYADPLRSGLAGRVSADGSTIDLDLTATETAK